MASVDFRFGSASHSHRPAPAPSPSPSSQRRSNQVESWRSQNTMAIPPFARDPTQSSVPSSGRLQHPTHRHSRRRFRTVSLLRIAWILSIVWGEWLCFRQTILSCHWPTPHEVASDEGLSQVAGQPFNVLIIADPQLPSMSYSYPTRAYLLRILSVKIIDNFMRKSWRLLLRSARPNAIVFLGDLLDGGVSTRDPIRFQSDVDRFYHTFAIPEHLSIANQNHSRIVYLAGNHDVGLFPSTSEANSSMARERFKKNWGSGKLNGALEWGNHSVIWLDAMDLIEEDKRAATGAAQESEGRVTQFIKGLGGPNMLLPKVLFTHVPLWRPENTSCGSLRESSQQIHQGAGFNYQNEVPEKLTKMVLETIQPTLVFSGDDHDYCQVTHTLTSSSLANPSPLQVHEISVKSFSMGMGVKQPGYHLLSLSNPARFARSPSDQTTFHKPCFLPDQIGIYTYIYLPLYLITLLVIFGPPAYKLIRNLTAVTRQQAKTNGLPIRPRSNHRKSLSRTLMFTKPPKSSLSSGSSSSAEDGRSDEESATGFASPQSRRSISMGLALDGGDGFHSPVMMSYHSPIDSAHEDRRHSHQSTSFGVDGQEGNYPTMFYGRNPSSRFQFDQSSWNPKPESFFIRVAALVGGKRLSESLKKWLIRKGLSNRNSGSGFRSASYRNRGIRGDRGLRNAVNDLWMVVFAPLDAFSSRGFDKYR
ncbi:hypothetical protein O181_015449 [Austropuccinia psidii MF-1]|uniref:Calcineurin-like phosphoesterase domain-containing protein n=1 Tax=Austropuccinia psidii MF-1 TaxID=1389203 RepID=A0A9Q3GQV1_9BASI|nr:hypothetical protein [Austropuccinia psidii MF-1]